MSRAADVKFAGFKEGKHPHRSTPFFDRPDEVTGEFDEVHPVSNYRAHIDWNRQRMGIYSMYPVEGE